MKSNKFIILSLITVLVFSLFAGCRKMGDAELSSNNSDVSSMVYDIVDVIEDNNQSTSSTELNENVEQDNQSDTLDSDSNTSSINSQVNNIVSVGDGDTVSDPDAPATFVDPDSSVEPDPETDAYNNATFTTSPKAKTGDVTTVKIAANGSVFYKIRSVSNKILTIKNTNAYVVYNGTRYDAKNGIVSFTVVTDELSSAQILFEIGNKGSKPESFTINFASPLGSSDNPEVIEAINDDFSVSIKKDNQQGYYYKYIATQEGKIRFYILSDANKGKLDTSKIVGYTDRGDPISANGVTNCLEETKYLITKKDESGTYIEYDAKIGDQFTVIAGQVDTKSSETTIVWKIVYM